MQLGLKTSAILLIFSAFGAASQDVPSRRLCKEPRVSSVSSVSSNKTAAAWFADWHKDEFSPANVSWEKYTDVFYSFASTTPDPAKLDESGLTGLPEFVSEARKHGVRPSIAIGGWSGSRFFSTAVASPLNRTAFVKTVTDLAVKYKADGLGFDWEHPNSVGIGCNLRDIHDTPNFLLFLQELRAHPVGKDLAITASASSAPWLGTEGIPVEDVSDFAKVLDFVAIMNYDICGPWSPTVGPNAPVDDTCAPGGDQMGSAVAAVKAWKKSGMPVEKLVLGVPAYGHSYRVRKQDAFVDGSTTQIALYSRFDSKSQPAGSRWDSRPGETDVCGVTSTVPGGIIQYWGMIELGYLDSLGNPKSGQIYKFDNCSKTPFIYDPKQEIMVSYDDPQSMRAKGQFIKEQKLKGFAMWEAGGDHGTDLIDAIRSEF